MCVCVCAHAVHSPLRGQERLHWSHEATATILCPPPTSSPSSPSPRLAARHTSGRHTTGFAPHPHPRALGRSMELFSFHLTRAGEEPYFLKKTQYSTQHSLSGYCVCPCICYRMFTKILILRAKWGHFWKWGHFGSSSQLQKTF